MFPPTAPGPPLDSLRARLDARRRERGQPPRTPLLNAPAQEVGLDQRLRELRAMEARRLGTRGAVGAAAREAVPALTQPVATDVLPPRPAGPMGAPSPEAPATIRGVAPDELRQRAVTENLRAAEVRRGRVRALSPGAAPAAFVERAVGRALAHLPGAVGEYGEHTAALGETHQREEAAGRESLPFVATLPADLANLYLELEAGGRIPGPIGRVINAPYKVPVVGSVEAGRLVQPGVEATVGRILRQSGREAARFGTLEGVKGAAEELPPEDVAAQALAGAGGGALWGAGSQAAREVMARALLYALRDRVVPLRERRLGAGPPVVPPAEPGAPPAEVVAPEPKPGAPRAPAGRPAPPTRGPQPVPAIEQLEREMAAGKYSDADLKRLRAGLFSRRADLPPEAQQAAMRVVDAIDTHLQGRGVAGAAPIVPEAEPAAPERPGAALHDVEGKPIPGTETPVRVAPAPGRQRPPTTAPEAAPLPRRRGRGIPTPEGAPAEGPALPTYSQERIGPFLPKIEAAAAMPATERALDIRHLRGKIDEAVMERKLSVPDAVELGVRLGQAAQKSEAEPAPVTAPPVAGTAERVTAAVIRVKGRDFDGPTHGDALLAAEKALGPTGLNEPHDELFRTSSGRVIDRREATEVAASARQMKPEQAAAVEAGEQVAAEGLDIAPQRKRKKPAVVGSIEPQAQPAGEITADTDIAPSPATQMQRAIDHLNAPETQANLAAQDAAVDRRIAAQSPEPAPPTTEAVVAQAAKQIVDAVTSAIKAATPAPTPATPTPATPEPEPELERAYGEARQPATAFPEEQQAQIARHGELVEQIERDQAIAAHYTTQYAIKGDVAPHGLGYNVHLKTRTFGRGYPALGRLRQAEKRLAALEKDMEPKALAEAHKRAEPIRQHVALRTNAELNPPGGTVREQPAYHGTPYRFDRFEQGKIGTGQGAASYGVGHYFAEVPGTARHYREQLAGEPGIAKWVVGNLPALARGTAEGTEYIDYTPQRDTSLPGPAPDAVIARAAIIEHLLASEPLFRSLAANPQALRQAAIDIVKSDRDEYQLEWVKAVPEAERILAGIEKRGVTFEFAERSGAVYHAQLNVEPYEWLDWDKRIVDQPENARRAINTVLRQEANHLEDAVPAGTNPPEPDDADYTVADVYRILGRVMDGGEAEVSAALRKAGAKGIRYLDQLSRDPGKAAKTSNFVVFDAKDIGPTTRVEEQGGAYRDHVLGAPEDRAEQAITTFGSVAEAKRAAIEVVRSAGRAAQLDLFETRPAPLDAAGREAAVAQAMLPHAWVPIKGQVPESPEALHGLLWPFRSPSMERLHFLLLDAQGDVLEHQMHTSGVLNFVQMAEGFADDLIADMKRTGAVEAVLAHNHPSGKPNVSTDDIAFTGFVGRKLAENGLRLRGQYVIDDVTGTWIAHHDDHYSVHDIKLPREPDPRDWTATAGPQVAGTGPAHLESGTKTILVGDMATVVLAATHATEKRVDVLYFDTQAQTVALEAHSLEAVRNARIWLPQRLKALAASYAVVAVGGPEATYYKTVAGFRGAEGVMDVFHVSQAEGQAHPRWISAAATGLIAPLPSADPSVPAHRVFERPERPGTNLPAKPPYPETLSPADASATRDRVSEEQKKPEIPGPVPGVRDALQRLVNPAGRTPAAAEMAHIVRARTGEFARENEVAHQVLASLRPLIKKLSKDQRLDFIDGIETGGRQSNAKLQPLADALRAALDQARQRVQDLGTGRLEHFITDYFPHLWERPEDARDLVSRILGKRPLQGPKSFLKKRTIPTTKEGIAAGLTPVTDNPIDLTLLKLREMNRYVMGQRILQDAKESGLLKFVRAGKAPERGYRRIDDAIARVYGPPTEEGAMTVRGEYYAPEPVATVLNNYLSPGLRGNPIFDAYMYVGNTLNAVQLGLSLFHLGFVSVDAITSQLALGLEQLVRGRPFSGVANAATMWAAPFTTFVRGSKVIQEYTKPGSVGGDLAAVVDALTAGGGRVRMDQFYKNNAVAAFLKAMRQRPGRTFLKGAAGAAAGGLLAGPVGAALGAGFLTGLLPAAFEVAAKPLMEVFVPRMKLGVFADLARLELSQLPPDATTEQVRAAMAKVWDSVDNRMGQMVYDNLFWSRALKDLGMASVRALGWNLGTFREIGGGVGDVLRRKPSHKMAYVIALPIAIGLLGAVMMYLFTGGGPETLQDYFEPRTGRKDADGNDERVQLPSYMKDVIAFTRHPLQTVGHKLHPLLDYVASMLQNSDYWGDQIRNAHDPLVEQLRQVADYTATQFTPIGIRNVQEQQRRLQTGARAALPFIGITPANREAVRSPAQNLMAEYLRERGVGGATPEEKAERQVRSDLVDRYRRGEATYSEVRDSLVAAGFTTDQTKSALRRMLEAPTVTRFKQLTLEQAEAVYAKGSPEERDVWGPILFRKQMGGRSRGGAPHAPRAPRR